MHSWLLATSSEKRKDSNATFCQTFNLSDRGSMKVSHTTEGQTVSPPHGRALERTTGRTV